MRLVARRGCEPARWRWVALSLRLLAVLLCLLAALRPAVIIQEKKKQAASVVFLLDDSTSMLLADEASGAALAASAKNRHEHQLVVDAMREALDPLCADLQIAEEPQLSKTAAVWHLYTPITGKIRERSTTALDLAIALHPTPAVGGVPATAAAELINELEGDRGFYAGAIGWCDQRGDGRWVVSIRGAQLSADRRTADAHSGGGIVAESDPDDEVGLLSAGEGE